MHLSAVYSRWFQLSGSYALDERGIVIVIAPVAVDGTGYADGTADGYLIYWDNPTVQYSACPPPAGWSVSGRYVWQSYNYLLVTGSATAYTSLITAPTAP